MSLLLLLTGASAPAPSAGTPKARPSLDLAVEVVTASGATTRWGPEDLEAANVPTGLSFSTQRMQGFADAAITLRRRIDRDYPDVHLFDSVAFIAADGSVAYEGRAGAMPRSFGSDHSVSLQSAGWMSHTRDRTFTEIFVDRDLGAWGPPSRTRRINLIANGTPDMGGWEVAPDQTNALPCITNRWTDLPVSDNRQEAWYDANGLSLGAVYFSIDMVTGIGPSTTWNHQMFFSTDDLHSNVGDGSTDPNGNDKAAGYHVPSAGDRKYLFMYAGHAATAPVGPYQSDWRHIAVYGNHGLTRRGPDPGGFYASDVIRHLASKYAPLLDTSGVQDTGFAIPHLVFRDRTMPYDAFLAVNAYHLWNLAVWENRTLHYAPTNLSDYDWEVRLTEQGVSVQLQGDSTEDLANGIVVQFQNVATGAQETLTPERYPELRDSSVENPANQHGLEFWTDYQLSIPTTRDAALNLGRAALAEFNQPKAPGSITVSHHIRDRGGNWQPVWKVRAGDRIVIADHPNDRPRLVHETSYSHDGRQVTIAVDSTMRRLEAVIDRLSTALSAANLT